MERSFYNEDFDFEELIKQKSDQYKIYPSEKVWRGVHGALHSSRRWYFLSFVLFLAGIAWFTIDQFSPGSRKLAEAKNKPTSSANNSNANEAVVLPFTPPTGGVYVKPKAASANTRKGLVIAMNEMPLVAVPAIDRSMESVSIETSIELKDETSEATAVKNFPVKRDALVSGSGEDKEIDQADIKAPGLENTLALFLKKGNILQELAENNVEDLDENLIATNNELADQKRINWLQENAVYELTRPKVKRISYQLTMAPTINYRKLVGNKDANLASDVKNIPIALNIEGDVDNLVNHKPAVGFELGSMFLYAVNKNLTFKSGLQFNYSRYDIHAYSSYQTERATIALNNFYGVNTDSINRYTRLRNFGGNTVKNLKNEYYQLSAPVGVEMLVLGKGKLQLHAGAMIQPTYLLNRDKYLITTDYKNYTSEASLVRPWNVNTSAEAFVSYKAGGFRFQVGPQLRYQLFSTYQNKYPVKEFLTEYAIKLGISKTIR